MDLTNRPFPTTDQPGNGSNEPDLHNFFLLSLSLSLSLSFSLSFSLSVYYLFIFPYELNRNGLIWYREFPPPIGHTFVRAIGGAAMGCVSSKAEHDAGFANVNLFQVRAKYFFFNQFSLAFISSFVHSLIPFSFKLLSPKSSRFNSSMLNQGGGLDVIIVYQII